MVHEPWTSMSGDAEDLRKSADLLDSLKSDIINVFTAKSGLSAERVSELASRTKQRDDARSALARTKTLMTALQRSYGLKGANVDEAGNPSGKNIWMGCAGDVLGGNVAEQFEHLGRRFPRSARCIG